MADDDNDDEFEDDEPEEPDDVDVADLEELEEGEEDDDESVLMDDALDEDALEDDGDATDGAPGATKTKARRAVEDEDEEEDDDEELYPDDVEASLDVILKDRLVVADAEEDDEDEVPDAEERAEGSTKVLPKRPDEFVCQSCFLVKHPSQLADPERQLCRDCV
jgi:hypothetical protein